ncbi:MAG TPA: VWA domain-containing protein [Verrucomicrobiae bacterium]|nr:VWA domain-containing protein [Verrucomicrobiae bacterium]
MRRLGMRRAAFVVPVALALLTAASPAAPPEAPHVSTLFESATSEIVLVEFWAVDLTGAPVTDLTAEEINLMVGSYRRPIDSFEHVLGPGGAAASPAPEVAGLPPAPGAGPASALARRFVLYFNDALSKSLGMTLARKAAIDFVSKSVPGDQFALANSGDLRRFRVLPFTDDHEEVVESLRRSLADPNRVSGLVLDLERPAVNEGEAHRIAPRRPEPEFGAASQVTQSARSTNRGLETLIAMLAPYRGPKSIVYFSDGITGLLNQDIEAATRAASAAQVTINTANTSGLVAGTADIEVAAASHAASNLATFADETGGLRTSLNDPSILFREMEAAEAGAYVLSFVPEGEADGRAHSIRLTCRRKGVELRYRHVFIRETASQARQRRLQAAFVAPGVHARFGLDAMTPLRAGARDLVLYVPADRLLFLPQGPAEAAQIEVGAVTVDANGKELDRVSRRMEIRLASGDSARRHAPLNLVLRGAVPAESRGVTAVVSDLNSGDVGAAEIDPASETHVAGLRGLALGDAQETSLWVDVPLGASGHSDAKTVAGPPALRPARRVGFSASERPVCEVRLDGPRPDGGKRLRLVIADEARTALILPLDGAEMAKDPGGAVVLRMPLPLRGVEPGSFVLRLEDLRAEGPATLGSMPIRITPETVAAPAPERQSLLASESGPSSDEGP